MQNSLFITLTFLGVLFVTPLGAKTAPFSIIQSGAIGDGIVDDTKAIQLALDKHDTIYFPRGVYSVSTLTVNDNKYIITDKNEVEIWQNNHSIGKQIIRIEGSNVTLGPLTCRGNINSDTSEFNIAVYIAPPFSRNTKNIRITGLKAINIRGDGICIGNSGNTFPENVYIEDIVVDNCYRNGISIVGGKNIFIKNVYVNHSGMQGIDIEGEGEAPALLENIKVTNLVAGNICISGGSLRAKKITLTDLKLDGRRQKSSPPFRPMNDAGILIYNAEDVTINKAIVKNMPGFAVFLGDIDTNRTVLSERVSIKDISLQNNALTDKIYKAYVCIMGVNKIYFRNLVATLTEGKVLFLGKSYSFEDTQYVTIFDSYIKGGKHLAQNCRLEANNITAITSGSCFLNMQTITLVNCNIVCPPTGMTVTRSQAQKATTIALLKKSVTGHVIRITNTKINSKKITTFLSSQHSWLQ
ncbi:MAG: glycosyl hydrolase family 28-related protein [Chitinophagaceae bacterium]